MISAGEIDLFCSKFLKWFHFNKVWDPLSFNVKHIQMFMILHKFSLPNMNISIDLGLTWI